MSPYEGHPVPSSTEKSSQLNVKKRLYPVVRHESDIQKASWDLQSSPGSFSPLSQYSVADEPADGPSVDTIKPCDQAANFGDQILSLRHDVRRLPGQLKALIVDTKQPPLLEAIEQSVRGIDQQTKARDNELQDVREILHGIRETIKGQITLGDHGGFGQVTTNGSGLLLSLEDIRIKLGSGLPEVLRKLGEIQVAQALASQTDGTESPSIVMNNVKPSSENSAECKRSGDEIAVALSEVHMKLDGLLALYQGPLAHPRSGGENLPNNPTGVNQIPEEVFPTIF
jgi:hypothetical protein